MEGIASWGEQALLALARLLVNPLYYIGLLIIVLQYRRQIRLERKLFHTRLHSLLGESWRTILWGWLGGLAASVLMLGFGFSMSFDAVLLLWGIALLLMLIRIRYACLAYSAGVAGCLFTIAAAFPETQHWAGVGWIFQTAAGIHIPSLLMLVAVLHLIEGLLVRSQGARLATPLFLRGKRGKIVGAYFLQGMWAVPLFLLVPASSGGLMLPWTPFWLESSSTGWTFIAFPALIGFTSYTLGHLPSEKSRQASGMLFIYAVTAAVLAITSFYWPILTLVAALICFLLHEWLIVAANRAEEEKKPLYVSDGEGLKILAVLPRSPAAEMGIQAGETIKRVNQRPVQTRAEFHQAMQLNPAYCKLEVMNRDGHVKFINKAVFADQHHQLGILLCPDEEAPFFVAHEAKGFLSLFRRKPDRVLSSGDAPELKT
ncbi:PDZ domain-containing protein [Paenibacillus senegalensis]|uniref:PDZ domain-containing protein n=1 Tax=Paenibacillus senegalensis TaxID=1465766 RepID=UPI000287DEC4|nr:PDZ domain-containing protein [Paenibacillus senegalensis]